MQEYEKIQRLEKMFKIQVEGAIGRVLLGLLRIESTVC